jgi:aryl-phospho-beta-D-glucosidase BglC (GH1 family)
VLLLLLLHLAAPVTRPRSTGSNLWSWPGAFPVDEINRDFAILKKDGFNAIRVFPIWPAFQPSHSTFNETSFANLATMVETAAIHGLSVTLSAITGGMSGRFYWPEWATTDMYTNTTMVAATTAYAVKLGQTMAPYLNTVISIDLGNEDNGIGGNTPGLSPGDVVRWTHTIYDALHQGCGCKVSDQH